MDEITFQKQIELTMWRAREGEDKSVPGEGSNLNSKLKGKKR